MHVRSLTVLALLGSLAAGGSALAQSVGAPAGSDPATVPGGTEGIAGPRNEREAIREGDAVAVPPGRAGVEREVPRTPDGAPAQPAR